MERKSIAAALAVAAAIAALCVGPAAQAGPIEDKVSSVAGQLTTKCKEVESVVKNAIGVPFGTQMSKAMEDLKPDPTSLRKQLAVVAILKAQCSRLKGGLKAAQDADLPAVRDRLVAGLRALATAQDEKRKRFEERAKNAKGDWRRRYDVLAAVARNLSTGYSMRGSRYAEIELAPKLVEVKSGIEYLDSVEELLDDLASSLGKVLAADEALRQLQDLTVTVDGITNSLKSFSETVLAGALSADVTPKPAAAAKKKS